jgi:hypothetical protein
VSTAAAENPTFDDITVEPLTEKLVSRMMQKMDPRNQEKDIRKVIRGDGRVRKGGRKEYGGVGECYLPSRMSPWISYHPEGMDEIRCTSWAGSDG